MVGHRVINNISTETNPKQERQQGPGEGKGENESEEPCVILLIQVNSKLGYFPKMT